MLMNVQPNDLIADALSAVGAWYPQKDAGIHCGYFELWGLLEKWMVDFKNSVKDFQESPYMEKYVGRAIPYNVSPFHFIIYYASPPNYPFVVFGDDAVMFGSFGGKRNDSLSVSFPVYRDVEAATKALDCFLGTSEIKSLLRSKEIKNILLRDIDEQFANAILKNNYSQKFSLKSLKEINYCIYDIHTTLALQGKVFSNLRWRLNRFNKGKHLVEHIPLSESREQVVHLIGQWRSQALKQRGFSYVDVRSDRFGAGFFENSAFDGSLESQRPGEKVNSLKTGKVISRVLKVDGKTASFNLGYPLGFHGESDVFAHAIGISDITIPGLAEYAQVDFWKQVSKKGYGFINDGPTWRKGLAVYKDKFRPVMRERYYWATISVVK